MVSVAHPDTCICFHHYYGWRLLCMRHHDMFTCIHFVLYRIECEYMESEIVFSPAATRPTPHNCYSVLVSFFSATVKNLAPDLHHTTTKQKQMAADSRDPGLCLMATLLRNRATCDQWPMKVVGYSVTGSHVHLYVQVYATHRCNVCKQSSRCVEIWRMYPKDCLGVACR